MDIVEIQAIYYMVAATGVLIAAVYYILNMRISQRNQELMLKAQEQTLENRRIEMIDNIASRTTNDEGLKRFFELMNYEWTDYEDFNRKYGNDNAEAAAKRVAQFNSYNKSGKMVRMGYASIEEMYDLGMLGVVFFWEKYKPVVEEVRVRYAGGGYCRDMEYLAGEMLKYMKSVDPSYRVPETLLRYVPDR